MLLVILLMVEADNDHQLVQNVRPAGEERATVVMVSETLRPLYSNQRGDPEEGRGQHCDRSHPLVSGEREREGKRRKVTLKSSCKIELLKFFEIHCTCTRLIKNNYKLIKIHVHV